MALGQKYQVAEENPSFSMTTNFYARTKRPRTWDTIVLIVFCSCLVAAFDYPVCASVGAEVTMTGGVGAAGPASDNRYDSSHPDSVVSCTQSLSTGVSSSVITVIVISSWHLASSMPCDQRRGKKLFYSVTSKIVDVKWEWNYFAVRVTCDQRM